MPTTSNFGWTTPADTDLVKDGAAAIRTLGNGIDSSMAQLKGGTTGQVLSKTNGTDMAFTWVTQDDANAIQNAIVDAKGDLIAATANDTPARLAVGNNGETLVADSSASTGLRWQSNFSSGKNKVINGDFGIWQRGTSFTTASNYCADRFIIDWNGGGTHTITRETFTPGTAPVAGYEGSFFFRWTNSVAQSGGTYTLLTTRLEDVRLFAGQTVTLSYWAKANSSVAAYTAPNITQNFGTGGSPSTQVVTAAASTPTYTTSWTRFSFTIAVPSISGKTLGTNNDSYLAIFIPLPLNATFTLDFWGVQLEAGNVATAFQTATGNPGSELAACQRYYQRLTPNVATSTYVGLADSTTLGLFTIPFTQTMRVRPTALETSGTSSDYAIRYTGTGTSDLTAGPTFSTSSVNHINLTATTGAVLTAGNAVMLRLKTANTSYLGWSAEL